MLVVAQLYKEKLEDEILKTWYKRENIYWHGGPGEYTVQLDDNNRDSHCFVSVDKNDDVLGYISYSIDWMARSAYQFGIISFRKGSIEFAKDLYQAICDCFEVYGLNRICWWCYADNPAIRGYRNFISKHGGRECGYCRQDTVLKDGKLHDSIWFEIMAEEFKKRRKGMTGEQKIERLKRFSSWNVQDDRWLDNDEIELLKTMYPKTCKMVDGRLGWLDDHECEEGKAIDSAIKALETIVELKKRKITLSDLENYMQFEDECVKKGFTFKSLIEAREKQELKKPIYEGDGYDPEGNIIFDEWMCPCCDARYEVDYDEYDFCPNCGQKLDWSEGENEPNQSTE